MSSTDRQLLDAVRGGDERAVDALLARHERQIYRFGLRMCGNEADAREVLQETLLAAFRNLAGFRGDAQLSTWLYQIARSFCIKLRRHGGAEDTRRNGQGGSGELASPAPAPDDRASAREMGQALAAAMQALPESSREALVLRDVEGLSAEEAAIIAGVDVGALKSRLHRARVELRQHLTTLLGETSDLGGPPPCPELANELGAYASADIDQATCTRIEEHLTRCSRCAGACEALKRTVSLCRRIPGDEVPAAVRAAVRHSLRAVVSATEGNRR